ncbi:SLC13 family permease, partial [Deinococcus pimensis]|uniref:SLC13 family permease n=1 Tax=Deinococcus pimensis TaxID=309888 RepID=UPI000480B01B
MTVVLLLLVLAVVLFATELLPVDVTALLLLAGLVVSGQLDPKEAFAGFGNDTVLTLASLFVLSRALLRTGVIESIGAFLTRRARGTTGLVRLMLTTVAGVSAFVSNTATTAVFLPVVLGLSRRAGVPAGRVMMPLAFASILGGTVTVIGTSTNLIVSGLLPRYGQKTLGFFELAWVGVPVLVAGMLYLFFVAPRLLPAAEGDIEERYGLRAYLADLALDEGSALAGKSLREAALGREHGLTVVTVVRGEEAVQAPGADFVLRGEDRLVVEGPSDRLMEATATLGVHLRSERKLRESLESGAERDAVRLVEVVVMPRSPLVGRTLREARFRERYGLSVLALHR